MLGAALISFGHFVGFFALTAALVLQLALLVESPSIETAQRIKRANVALWIALTLLLVFGFLRVFHFEKSAEFYAGNLFFWIKLALFFAAAALALYPSAIYRRWRSELAQGVAPDLTHDAVLRIKKFIHWELLLILGMLTCASLMAKGIGTGG